MKRVFQSIPAVVLLLSVSFGAHAAGSTQDAVDPRLDNRAPGEGRVGGIGVVITIRGGALTIMDVKPTSPAATAALQVGDRIISVDGRSTASLRIGEAVDLLRGRYGTAVTVIVARDGWTGPRTLTLQRLFLLDAPAPPPGF